MREEGVLLEYGLFRGLARHCVGCCAVSCASHRCSDAGNPWAVSLQSAGQPGGAMVESGVMAGAASQAAMPRGAFPRVPCRARRSD